MTTRFPQSGASVNYRIKAEYASKIKAIFWAAGPDAVHRLYPGDTSTTIITRAPSGCTFDTENGVIAGPNHSAEGVYFLDFVAGGYGVSENTAFGFGASYWGDIKYGLYAFAAISTNDAPMDQYQNGSRILIGKNAYSIEVGISGYGSAFSESVSDNVKSWMGTAFRYNPSDPINNFRLWVNGAELTPQRTNRTPTSTALIGDTATPLRFGGSDTGSNNAAGWFECVYVHTGLSDAELNAITADPSIIIETSSGGSIDATADGVTLTGTATLEPGTAAGGSGAVDATADGVTLTGTATLTPGTATGGASGSFVSSPMYSSGILQTSVALDWTWYPGAIGAAPTALLVHGSGVTAGDGTLTMPGLPAGSGYYLAEGLDLNGEVLVAFEYGTVT